MEDRLQVIENINDETKMKLKYEIPIWHQPHENKVNHLN